jgi:hypothetical protein
MVRRPFAIALATALMISVAGTAYAQQAPAVTTKPAKPAAKPAVPEGLPNNIRIELTITDQAGPGEAGKRTVSMLVADRKNGSVRSSGQVMTPSGGGRFNVALNVDAMPVILKDGLMRLDVTLEYVPKPGSDNASSGEGRGSLNERLSLLVESGKPLIVSQASDPTSDRKISIELTATILK